ncbi:MAG: site-specific DNA-methyltransferase [Flavobacterium sp.]|nr:MAG: site-specific DNA-methyltransferase [Flavobacterium sp.]
MKIYAALEKALKKEPNFVSDNGELRKWVVLGKAQNYDIELISLLLDDPELKGFFFLKVKEALVFNQSLFVQFLEQKSYLNNSYTAYKNKIGLTIDSKYLKQRNEISLAWPFKDCVLEGGQGKEEENKEEIFFNEILAQDEITQLLEPKVLSNFKKYSLEGEEKVVAFNRDLTGVITDNLILKGNNLLALHTLKAEFAGKVKLIYIDPPYNTGGDGFNYNDNFTHSAWMTFMKNRLEVAKQLLTDDGLIIVQIDSSRNNKNGRIGSPEFPYLHILMDDIFHRKNYIGHLHWKKKKQPSYLSKIAGVMESILIYSNNEAKIGKLQLGNLSDNTTRVDNADNNYTVRILMAGVGYMGAENTTIKKGTYKNKTMTTEFLDDVVIERGKTIKPVRVKAKFRTSQDEISRFCELNLLYITERNSLRRFKSEEEKEKGKTITDLLLDWGQNQDATDELRKLFNVEDDSKPFATPKPELLLHNLISCCTDEDDIVLDFFGGSGTTQAVAHKLRRQYIGVEQLDYVKTILVERLKKVISGEQGGVSKLTEWKGGGSFIYLELKKYNQSFIDQIELAKNSGEMLEIWGEMKSKSFLNYNIDIQKQEAHLSEFMALSLIEQKHHLVEILDKNQLYVNISSLNDTDFAVTEEEKAITKDFYQLKN